MGSEILPVIVSQLGKLSYFILSINLFKQGLDNSELINWFVRNIKVRC
jgi:hypothetical protein